MNIFGGKGGIFVLGMFSLRIDSKCINTKFLFQVHQFVMRVAECCQKNGI